MQSKKLTQEIFFGCVCERERKLEKGQTQSGTQNRVSEANGVLKWSTIHGFLTVTLPWSTFFLLKNIPFCEIVPVHPYPRKFPTILAGKSGIPRGISEGCFDLG